MTLLEFATGVVPPQGEILVYHTGDPASIQALNISTIANEGTNIANSLSNLTTIVLTLSGTAYPLNVEYTNAYTGYYHVKVQNTTIPSGLLSNGNFINEIGVNFTFLVPSIQQANFERSDYRVLSGMAEINRSSQYIFDVDRSKYSGTGSRPVNYQAIISGSATPAQYQELNHTSVGLTNSRYVGAKTSIADYGVNSAINAQPFAGAIYLSSSLDSFICSQSLSDRDIEEYLFTGNLEFPASGSRVFTLVSNKVIPIRNRKIWSKNNTSIYYANQDGFITDSGTLCGI